MPFGLDQPYWVDDPDFDIEFHVRSLALPSPGSDAQLAEQVAALHARPLDRSRPLWELYLITGLSGRRAAIYSKIHHAAIDGVSGGDVLTAVLDLTPEGRPAPERAAVRGRDAPGRAVAARPQRGDPGHATAAGRPPGHRAGPLGARGSRWPPGRWRSGSPGATTRR